MNCEQFENRILDYQDDHLSASEREAVQSHLASCPACQALAQQLQQLDATLTRTVRIPASPVNFRVRLHERIQAETVVLPEAQRAERRRQLQAEYEAGLAQFGRFVLPRQFVGSLGFAVLTGLIGWRLWLLLPGLANQFAESGLTSVNQALLTYCAAGVIFLGVGLAATLPQQFRKLRSAF
jgi:hypothetical protein